MKAQERAQAIISEFCSDYLFVGFSGDDEILCFSTKKYAKEVLKRMPELARVINMEGNRLDGRGEDD